jgi:hypothetical protein
MAGVDDDIIRRRKEKASPEVQALYDDLMAVGASGTELGGPEFDAFEVRIEGLSAEDRAEFVALMETTDFGMQRRIQENQEVVDALDGAYRVFDAAHNKLKAEGKPIDPDMTIDEAYRVLED